MRASDDSLADAGTGVVGATEVERPLGTATALAVSFGLVAAIAGLAWLSCSSRASASLATAASGAPEIGRTEVMVYGGLWIWSYVAEENGVRRIERERWELHPVGGDQVAGNYVREVFALSTDGEPFTCNQSLAYRTRTVYQVRGTLADGDLALEETGYEVAPSPCERGFRDLGRYRGSIDGEELVLRWSGGQETLHRPSDAELAAEASSDEPDKIAAAAAAPLRGSWRWTSRSPDTGGRTRVEVEEWQLTEGDAGAIDGTYVRTVTVFDEDGAVFACNGDTRFVYRDRFTLRGHRIGDELSLTEIAVDPEPNPCLETTEPRHLDTATGALLGGYLDLTWRGRRRQVLYRP
jgi:hypothetical protein